MSNHKTSRRQNSYIKDVEHVLNYMNEKNYDLALDADDIKTEEYYIQKTLNNSNYSKLVSNEVFQTKHRQNIENNSVHNGNYSNGKYDKNIRVQYNNLEESDSDTIVDLKIFIEELAINCNTNQLKILAYYLTNIGLDRLVDNNSSIECVKNLHEYILYIYDNNIFKLNDLYSFIGSKHKSETARKSICDLVRNKFPLLTSN